MRHISSVIVILLAVSAPAQATGLDRTYVIGKFGWALERFGRDVAILRATIGDDVHGSPGSLIISCDRGTRRLTLILPKSARNANGGLASAGAILVRPLGPTAAGFLAVTARTAGLRPDALIILEDTTAVNRPVLAIGRMFVTRPEGLDFLLHIGAGVVTLSGLTPLRLAVSSRKVDEVAFRDFATTCDYQGPRP